MVVWGFGVEVLNWAFGFGVLVDGVCACGVWPSGVFRVWALYLDLGKKTLHGNKMSRLFCNKLGRKLC